VPWLDVCWQYTPAVLRATCPRAELLRGYLVGRSKKVSDGENERCISVIVPEGAKKPMPVLFWFHGGGGNAQRCGGGFGIPFNLSLSKGFAIVCGEAIQDGNGWRIPEVVTDETGTPCKASDSLEITYMNNAIAELAKDGNTFDTSRIFTSGCSMGSAFSEYIASCIKEDQPNVISAFATHSTGLKVKGDGNKFPAATLDRKYTWGECPKCQYFPFKPKAFNDTLGLKACVFDNTGDKSIQDPQFYRSSVALAKKWQALGMKTETHFAEGGHCQIHSYEDIVTCLDDGTNRLVAGGSPPSPSPPSPFPPSPPSPTPPSPPSPDQPSADCQKCFIDNCPHLHKAASAACNNCAMSHQKTCASSCKPCPFRKAVSWFCEGDSKVQLVLTV